MGGKEMGNGMRRGALLAVILAGMGCAQVGSPDGGARDEDAPQVVQAQPAFGTTQFDQNAFVLDFDEFVQLQDARRQILVSPPLPTPPKAMVRGRSVRVELGDSLMVDRTYIVQFGEAVKDLREANVAKGLQYVFTTGDVLDSGRVGGQAVDAWTGEAVEGTRVLLFAGGLPEGIVDAALPDSVRPLPDYVGLVDDSGRFDVGFLPRTAFGFVVLDDVNGNYRADDGESLGWFDGLLESVADSLGWSAMQGVPAVRMDSPPVVPTTYTTGLRVDSSGYFRAALAGLSALQEGPDGLPQSALSVSLSGPGGPVELGIEGDSIWADLPNFDPNLEVGGPWILTHPSGMDTLSFRQVDPAAAPSPAGAAERYADAADRFRIRLAPLPVALDTQLCSGMVVQDGDTSELPRGRFALDGPHLEVGPLPQGAVVSLMLEPGAVNGLGGATKDTLEWRVNVRKPSDYGVIRVLKDTSMTADTTDVWMLLNASGLPLREARMDEEGRFAGLLPGRYGLARITDLNGDGRWNGARPAEGLPPEPVQQWAEGVDVRAGWEVEITTEVHPRP
jgi:hypothetical protein